MIGIDLSDVLEGQDFNEEILISHVNGMSLDIAKIYKINTKAVYIDEIYQDKVNKKAFDDAGYTVWSPRKSSSAIGVTNRLEGKSRTVTAVVDNAADAPTVIRGVANFLDKNDASFDTVKITSRP